MADPKRSCDRTKTVLIVDDHTIIRDGIKAILKHKPDYKVIGEGADGVQAIRMCQEHSPAIVILDLNLPGLNGIDTAIEILRFRPDTKIVILSMYDDEASVINAIRAGVCGYVLKTASDATLVNALEVVSQGGTYLSPTISTRLLSSVQRGRLEDADINMASPVERLTDRERQVLRLVAQGLSSKEIAVVLGLAVQTIRTYRKTIMKKLSVTNVAGLTQLAIAAGLLIPSEIAYKSSRKPDDVNEGEG